MELNYNRQYPSIDDLRARAQKKIPRFAFEYMDGGGNEDVNLEKNRSDIQSVELEPNYLVAHSQSSIKTELFGILSVLDHKKRPPQELPRELHGNTPAPVIVAHFVVFVF